MVPPVLLGPCRLKATVLENKEAHATHCQAVVLDCGFLCCLDSCSEWLMMAQRHFLGPPQSMLLPECILASRSQRGLNGPGIYLETDRLPAFCFSETVFWDLGRRSDL